MATPFLKVYDAFLARISADDWMLEEELAIVERDWRALLEMAIARFKYPRTKLEFEITDNDGIAQYQFIDDLSNEEIQLLALMMKHEWVKRCIASYNEIRYLYADKDFSQANHLDKLLKLESAVKLEVEDAKDDYDRSRGKTPAAIFGRLAGKKHIN